MGKIQAVLIDFGGVMYRVPDLHKIQRWMARFGIRDMSVFNMLNASPRESAYVRDLWTGRKQEQEAWAELMKSWKMRPGVLNLLRKRSLNQRNLNKDLIAYVESLRERLTTAILTNAGTDFRATFCEAFALDRLVHQVIISAEVGLCKPEPEIYHFAANRLGLLPEQIVFVDDMLENVEGAKEAGMNAFLFTTEQQAIQTLQSYLQ